MFIRYPHLEKFGNLEVEGIEHGIAYVFPKLDGTNGSIWWGESNRQEPRIRFGSRNRELSLESDNAGMANALCNDGRLGRFFNEYPRLRLYGEWLVPHTLKGYVDDAWRKFYVFDVYSDETQQFLSYEDYKPKLEEFGLDYIPCFWKIKDGDLEKFIKCAKDCRYLLKDDCEVGEGVVIKNYNWINKFQRQTWAKIITSEFKTQHIHAMGPMEIGNITNEERIVDFACTEALIEKEYAKIVNENGGWSAKYIPRLLETVYYCVVTEELWGALKKINFGTINFKSLRHYVIEKIKKTKPELF